MNESTSASQQFLGLKILNAMNKLSSAGPGTHGKGHNPWWEIVGMRGTGKGDEAEEEGKGWSMESLIWYDLI